MKKLPILLLLLTGMCGCHGHPDNPERSAEEQAKRDSLALHVGVMPTMDCLPFYYAEQMGIYEKLGLDVRLRTYMALLDCDTALARRRVEVCYTDLIRALLLQKEGHALRVIMKADGGEQLVTARSKRIKTLAQLKERMVGIARHSATDSYSDAIMDSAGLEKEAIFRPQINDIRLRCAMLCNGTLDAVFLPEPYATQALAEGNRRIFGQPLSASPQLMAVAMTESAYADEHRCRQTRLLLEGYNRAADALNRNPQPDSLRALWISIYRLSAQAIDTLRLPHFEPAAPQHEDNVAAAIEWLRSRELLPTDFNTDSLVSHKFTRK